MLTILGIHNFNIQITDLLYKLAHSEDKETAYRSILGLGLISAGTNNARVSSLIKNLGFYYSDDSERDFQFVVRIALGLLYAGKGILTLSQFQ
jgi:26S proteasome regulatory subunit N1